MHEAKPSSVHSVDKIKTLAKFDMFKDSSMTTITCDRKNDNIETLLMFLLYHFFYQKQGSTLPNLKYIWTGTFMLLKLDL